MRTLTNIKKIDIKHSKGAKRQDDGTWAFDDAVEVDYMGDRRPDHYYTWARYDQENNFRDLLGWKHELGYKEVIPSEEEDVYPLGCPINEAGFYVFMDAIFVKVPLVMHLERLVENAERGKKQLAGKILQFKQSMRGEGIVQSDAEVDEMIKYFGVSG